MVHLHRRPPGPCSTVSAAARVGILVAVVLALLAAATTARAELSSPLPSDGFAAAPVLTPNVGWVADTAAYTIEAGESYTSETPDATCGGVQMDRTAWYRVIGTGGAIVISTAGSGYDTVVAVYGPDTYELACNDDANGTADMTSRVRFASRAGATYWVQLGRCVGTGCGATASTALSITALTNDGRSDAVPVVDDVATTFGATTDAGETTTCRGTPYDSTVWFAWKAPAKGHVSFSATTVTGLATALYRGAANTPVTCGLSTEFRPATVEADVAAGEVVMLQIGATEAQANFSLSSRFTEDRDIDDDGYSAPADCNDGDAAIHPNATETPYDGVDQDCARGDLVDVDQDGHAKAPIGDDCNDTDASIHPGAPERAGDSVDEDCSGAAAPGTLRTTADVSFGSTARPRGRLFGELKITGLRRGDRVSVRCTGPGCPRKGRLLSKTATGRSFVSRVYRNRVLRPGAVVRISVRPASGNFYGWSEEYAVHGKRALRKRLCQMTTDGRRFGCQAG